MPETTKKSRDALNSDNAIVERFKPASLADGTRREAERSEDQAKMKGKNFEV